MKKIIIFMFVLLCIPITVSAGDKTCNTYASKGRSVCTSKTYKGYKCAWNGNKKGGARCYKSNNLAESVKETITSCKQIKSHETCSSSKVNGFECIWRQGACYGGTDDGSDKTIIADDQNDRDKQEANAVKDDNVQTAPGTTIIVEEFSFCNQVGVLKTFQLVGYLITLIKVLVPLLLIIFGSIDMGKAVLGGDEKAIKSATTMLVVRAVGGIVIFFIPTIINAVTSLISGWSGIESKFQNCQTCLLKTGSCGSKIETAYLKEACSSAKKTTDGKYDDEYNDIHCSNSTCKKGSKSLTCK